MVNEVLNLGVVCVPDRWVAVGPVLVAAREFAIPVVYVERRIASQDSSDIDTDTYTVIFCNENSRSYTDWPFLEFSTFRDAQLDRLKRHHRKKRGPHGLPPIRPADHHQLTQGVGNG